MSWHRIDMGMDMDMHMDMEIDMEIEVKMQLDMHMGNDARPCFAGLCRYSPLCRAATCSRGSGAGCSTGKPLLAVLAGVKRWIPA